MIGCHLSVTNLKYAQSLAASSVQIFLTPPKRLTRKPKDDRYIDDLIGKIKTQSIECLSVHSSYLINLSRDPSEVHKAINSLTMDCLDLARIEDRLKKDMIDCKITGVVVHMGKHLKQTHKIGVHNYIKNIISVLECIPKNIHILLETPAGQGTEICHSLDDFYKMFQNIKNHHQNIAVCLDTCHIFSCGQDLRNLSDDYLTNINCLFGNNIRLIHMNDCMVECGARKDRHAPLGSGYIFPKTIETPHKALISWLSYSHKNNVPIVLETNYVNFGNEIKHMRHIINTLNDSLKGSFKEQNKSSESNKKIIQFLTELADMEKTKQNRYKERAYRNAIKSIECYFGEILSGSDALMLDGVGKSIAGKIQEIIDTGYVQKLKEWKNDNKGLYKAVAKLCSVGGIGPVFAKSLYTEYNISNITQLRNQTKTNPDLLTSAQTLNLKHYTQLKKRLPRKLITEFKEWFCDLIIVGEIVGSYRRGAETSKDIDIIIHPDNSLPWSQLLNKLTESKKLVGIISQGKSKLMCLIKYKSRVIHVDILQVVEPDQYVSMILYFTGSKENNILMRQKAIERGLTLNEYGLFDEKKNRIDCETEDEYFVKLGMKPLIPTER